MVDSVPVLTSLVMMQLTALPFPETVRISEAWDAAESAVHEAGLRLYDSGAPGSIDAADEVRVHLERWYRLNSDFQQSQLLVSSAVLSGLHQLEERLKYAPMREVISFLGLIAPLISTFTSTLHRLPVSEWASLEPQLRMLVRSADLVHESIRAYGIQ